MENDNAKLKKVRHFLKDKNYFLLIAALIVIWQWKSVVEILIFNHKAIGLLFIPFIFVFIWLWKRARDVESFDKKTLLTTASIIFAVFFFLFNNFEMNTDRIQAVRVANHHNCGVARGNISNLGVYKGERFSLNYFVLEPYKENLEFAIKYPSILSLTFLQKVYIEMESANSLMRVVEELNVPGIDPFIADRVKLVIEERTNDIINISKEVEQKVCINLIERKENLIIKILSKFLNK